MTIQRFFSAKELNLGSLSKSNLTDSASDNLTSANDKYQVCAQSAGSKLTRLS